MDLSNLNELQWETRGQWPIEVKVITCLLVAGFVFFLFYYLLVMPEFDTYDADLMLEAKVKEEFAKKYDQSANLNVYKKQLAEMQAHFGALLKALPRGDEMPSLLTDISKAGTNLGLTFELFDPQDEVLHTGYAEISVNIVVRGSYRQLAVFVSHIAQISRIITFHDFDIRRAPTVLGAEPEPALLNQERLVMTMTIKIYRYRP